jgi:hypothetical protein
MEEHRMRKGFRPVLWGVFVLIMVFAVSCSPRPAGSAAGAEPAAPVVEVEGPIEEVVEEVGAVISGEEPAASAEGTGAGGQQPASDTGLAADIPVPEEAYQVQIARQGRTVIFQIDGTIDEMVTFYQENLPAAGWELAGPPDTSMGSIASMLRKNAVGDQLTVNMQGNQLGGFVRVTVTVIRGG